MSKIILGGGLSGLSAAYYLSKTVVNQPITIIESSKHLGGWIKSHMVQDGVIFEQGPRTIRPQGKTGVNTLHMIEDLGLTTKILPILSSHPSATNRMIYVNGQLHSLPSNIKSLFKVIPPFSKPLIMYLFQDVLSPKKSVNDESIYDFVSRRFGSEFADYLIAPLIRGICAGNAKEISVNFLMKQLFEYEQEYGSISKGIVRNFFKKQERQVELTGLPLRAKQEKWRIYTFENGLETLPKALENHVRSQVNIEVNSKCTKLEVSEKECVLHLDNGNSLSAEHVISTIPAGNLATILQDQHPQLADMLRFINCVTVGVVNLSYDRNLISNPGFGFLVPPTEDIPILGVIYDSCCFPKGDKTILTVMMGGHWFEQLFGENPKETLLLQTAKDQLRTILGISEEPTQFKVNILHKCIPQYVVGHSENLCKINDYVRKHKLSLSLCGSSYYGVGVNDVILSAKNVIDNLEAT